MRNIVWFISESFVSKQKFLLRFTFYLYQQARACLCVFIYIMFCARACR